MSSFEQEKIRAGGLEPLEKNSESLDFQKDSLDFGVGSEVETQKGELPPALEAAEPVYTEGSVTFSDEKPLPTKQPWLNGHRWKPGQSGNPAGRPRYEPGTKKVKVDRRKQFKEMFADAGEGLIQKAVDIAMTGKDTRLLIELLKYVSPSAKAETDMYDLGLPEDATASERLVAIQIAVTSGRLSPEAATMMSKSIKDAVESEKILQAQQGIAELQQRLKTISGGGRV